MSQEKSQKKRLPLKARNIHPNDFDQVSKIIAQKLNQEIHRRPQVQKVVIRDSKVVGYATMKMVAEVMMMLDSNLSTRDKAESLALLMEEGQKEADKLESNFIYMCTPDEQYAKLVEKHFGFQLLKGHFFLRKKVR